MFEEMLSGTYCGTPLNPSELWLRWNLDPVLLLMLAVMAVALRRSPSGRLAAAALAVAFVSPLCALSASLFSARVVHHVLLIAVAAPLLAVAVPARRAVSATTAFLLSTLVLWAWHLPAAYDLALSNMAVYWIMQATLVATAIVFWQTAIRPGHPQGQGLLLILAGYMQMALLGALLTFAREPLYTIHAVAPLDWGFTPLGDQQLGGLIMWVPAAVPFMVVGAVLACRQWRGLTRMQA
jgi:putative membrane protein